MSRAGAVFFLFLGIALATTACKRTPPPPEIDPPKSGDEIKPESPQAPKPAFQRDQALNQAQLRAQAKGLVQQWMDAQNQGDFARYLSHYSTHGFRGIKRTLKGGSSRFDLEGWAQDRKRMFESPMKVAVRELRVQTWLDQDSSLAPGSVELRFVQQWRNPRYADHGNKIMRLWMAPNDSKLKIAYEDLVNSEPGWDYRVQKKPDKAPEGGDLIRIDDLRGNTYIEKLGLVSPHQRAKLARTLIKEGRFACKEIVQGDVCGDPVIHFRSLPPDATMQNPCLRRRVARYVITWLADADLLRLQPQLTSIMRLAAPEKALHDEVVKRFKKMGKAGEAQLVELLVGAHADYREHLKEDVLKDLSHTSLRELLIEGHYAQAIAPLNLEAGDLAKIAQDKNLYRRHRLDAIKKLGSIEFEHKKELYRQLVKDPDCEIAFMAALALSKLGDSSAMPSASSTQRPRALCMLLFDQDQARFESVFRAFVHPSKGMIVRTKEENDFLHSHLFEDRQTKIPESEYIFRTRKRVLRNQVSRENLSPEWALNQEKGRRTPANRVTLPFGHIEVRWYKVDGKPHYVRSIDSEEWFGCPC